MSLAALASSGIQTTVLSGSLLLAMPLALAAGAVSFFSPCCLPLVPGYLSLVTGLTGEELAAGADGGGVASAGGSSRARVVTGTALFVLGFAVVFTSYGALFGGLGFVLLRHQTVINRVFGTITILLGLTFLGVFSRFAFTGREFRIHRSPRAGLLGAPMLGVLFGVGWTPCIGPTLAAVLGLSAASGTALRGALLAFGYSVGLGLPFLVAGLAFRKAARAFAVVRRHYVWVLRAGGTLLVTIGVLEATGVWASLIARLQGVISGYATPL
ncbi:MAG: cytochrome c biogenesis protein CcdA [Actinomycetota bacterium]